MAADKFVAAFILVAFIAKGHCVEIFPNQSIGGGLGSQNIWNVFAPPGSFSNVPRKNSGLYWRQFDGVVPDDAVLGGFNIVDGKKTDIFLGQVNTLKEVAQIQPVAVYNNSKSVTYSFEGVFDSDLEIKILCSSDKGKLAWVAKGSFSELSARNALIVAGRERTTYTLYFGRAIHNGRTVVGKIHANDGKPHMYFPLDRKETEPAEYEILARADLLPGYPKQHIIEVLVV